MRHLVHEGELDVSAFDWHAFPLRMASEEHKVVVIWQQNNSPIHLVAAASSIVRISRQNNACWRQGNRTTGAPGRKKRPFYLSMLHLS